MYLVQLRHNKGNVKNINVDEQSTVHEFKVTISQIIKAEPNSFQLFWGGKILDDSLKEQTLQKLGIGSNSVIDVEEKKKEQDKANLIVEYGSDRVLLKTTREEGLDSIKKRIANLFHCKLAEFDLLFKDQVLSEQNGAISEYGMENGQTIRVIRKIPMQEGLGNKIRIVESITSSSGEPDQKDQQSSLANEKKQFHVHKNLSCSASLQIIKQPEDQKNPVMKTSSIQPYTMHKNQINELGQKQNKLTKIEDIKETKSFGSLESAKSQQIEVQIFSENGTKYYRVSCPFGCKVIQLRQTLAKAQRIKVQNLQLIQAKGIDLVEMLNQNGDSIRLTYRIVPEIF